MVSLSNKKISRNITGEKVPFVSVIVLNYNGKQHLKECFASLEKLNYPKDKYEVIMVDNGSTDSSISYVKNNFPWVRILELDKNYGFTEGNNKGAKVAKGEYIAFLNNDTKVDKNWLVELVKEVKGDIVAGASKVLFYNDKDIINFGGGKLMAWGFPYEEGCGERDREEFNQRKYIHHSTGSSMLVNKKIFLDFDGFDPDYHSYHEDVDLSWRFWLYGFKVIYVPHSIVYHKGSGTLGASPFKILLMGKNVYATMIKNFGIKNLLKSLIIYSMFHFSMFIFLFLQRKFSLASAQLKVYWIVIKELKKNIRKRKTIQKNRKLSDYELEKIGLITNFADSCKETLRMFKYRDKLKI